MREIPHSPVARYEVANLFGSLVAETILASVHVRARKQAGHMGASDLIKALQNTLRGGGRPHTGNIGPLLWTAKFTGRTVDDTDWLIFGYRPRGTRSALRYCTACGFWD